MDIISLYCKSYNRDVDRVKILLDSISKYNEDNIPFYISVPQQDIELFRSKLGTNNYTLIPDEDIYQTDLPGYLSQQIVKSNFWKLGLSTNYLCLDSDSIFIKPFYKSDFIFKGDIPHTVCHQQKPLFEWAVGRLPFDPKNGFIKDKEKVMSLFGRKGVYYDFGPSPVIWSSKVWKHLEEIYIKPNNLTFEQLIQHCASEFTWYGEALLNMKFPIYPLEPLFKVYHYSEQYGEDKSRGITVDQISKNYLGIILQSNWGAPLNY